MCAWVATEFGLTVTPVSPISLVWWNITSIIGPNKIIDGRGCRWRILVWRCCTGVLRGLRHCVHHTLPRHCWRPLARGDVSSCTAQLVHISLLAKSPLRIALLQLSQALPRLNEDGSSNWRVAGFTAGFTIVVIWVMLQVGTGLRMQFSEI